MTSNIALRKRWYPSPSQCCRGRIAPDPAGPWGGVKSSGLGRELSPGAIAAYQNLKTVYA